MLRVGHSANIELFKYEADPQRHDLPKNSDWSGHHVAFYVTDIEAAVEYMDSRGVTRMFGPFTLTDGPAAGQSINYFRTPWNSYIEFISYPNGMAYQFAPGVHPLWSPKQNGLDSEVTKVPGLLGIDHIGITVPDIEVAAGWLEQNLGMVNPLTFGPFSDPVGDFMTQLVDVNPRAVVEQIRMLRGGDGPGVELFKYTSPDQDQNVPAQLRLRRAPSRVLRAPHREERRHSAAACRHEARRAADAHRRPRSRAVDQLLRDAVRHRRRADQLPARDGVRGTAPIPLWDPRHNHP